MTVSTKKPLEEGERVVLLRSFQTRDDLDALTTHLFYSTAAHPWSLANPDRAHWKILQEQDQVYVDYIRAKTYEHTHIPLDPAIAGWAPVFIAEELGHSEREYLRRVNRYGRAVGLPGLSPRGLRHDCIYRFGRAVAWDLNILTALFGTDPKTLLRYMASDRAKTYSSAIVANGFA